MKMANGTETASGVIWRGNTARKAAVAAGNGLSSRNRENIVGWLPRGNSIDG